MVREEKLKAVEELRGLMKKYSTIGIIDMQKLPSKQLQEIKKQLRDKALIKMTKKSILLHAIKELNKEKIGEIEKFIPLQPAIVLTDSEAFKFYLTVDKLKSSSFAKEGDIAQEDIVITAGPTSLLPGPAISEFAKLKIPTSVEEGKIAIKKDTLVAKKGDMTSKDLASVLRKLKIEPIKVGLNIVAIYDKGMIYTKDVLSLVGDAYINKMKQAFNEALNLSTAICYPTKVNIKYLLAKAYQNAETMKKLGV